MNKRDKILEAALKLFVEFGFHGTPTSLIAREADVSNGTLFHYFKTKEELILSLYDVTKNEFNAFLLAKIDPTEHLETNAKTIIAQALSWAIAHPQPFFYIQQIYLSPYIAQIPAEQHEKYMHLHYELIREGQKAGIIKPLPADFIIALINNHIFGVYQYLQYGHTENPQAIIEQSIELIWDMITA